MTDKKDFYMTLAIIIDTKPMFHKPLNQMDICMIFIFYQLFLTTGIPCTKNKKYHTIRTVLKSIGKVVETKAIKSGSVKPLLLCC